MKKDDNVVQTVQADIVIIGAGPVGMGLFLALARLNYRVLLLNRSPELEGKKAADFDARNYALTPENMTWLEGLGVTRSIFSAGTPMEAMHVVYEAGAAFFELSAHQIRQPYLAWMVRHDQLCAAFAGALEASSLGYTVEQMSTYPQGVWNGVTFDSLQWSADSVSVRIQQSDQKIVIQTKLVIGADGAQSWVREQSGVFAQTEAYSHQALVGCFETEKPHGGIAYQWFKKNGDVMAWLPMPKGVGVVWSCSKDSVIFDGEYLHDSQRIADEISRCGQQRLGQWRYQGGLAVFPLSRHHLKGILPPRVMLVGDARQRMHPLAGQGLNLGFIEARQIVGAIEAFPSRDPGHPWIKARIDQRESLAQRLMPLGVDALWRCNQTDVLPRPIQRLLGLGWRGVHQSGVLKYLISHGVAI